MFYAFKGFVPVVHPTSFVHPLAAVTGNVVIGAHCYIGPGAALRGDWGGIVLEDGCNVQENCIIHMFPGATVLLRKGAHIGHGSIVHGATIGKNVLVGMHTVIMDNVVVGDDSIIGAMSLLTEGMQVPSRKVVVGHPAKIIKDVSDEMLKWKTKGTEIYHALPAECIAAMKECKPLRKKQDKKKQSGSYKTWKKTKK